VARTEVATDRWRRSEVENCGAPAPRRRFLRFGRRRIIQREGEVVAVIVVGVSHTTAPIDVREKLAFRPWEALHVLARLSGDGLIREGVVVSTCNRTEIYAVEQNDDSVARISTLLSD